MKTLNDFATECHKIAVDKGWYDPPKSIGEQIAMIHSEVSEALEEVREDRPLTYNYFSINPASLRTIHLHENSPDEALWQEFWAVMYIYSENTVIPWDHMPESLFSGRIWDWLVEQGIAKPEGFGVELADVMIRIFDVCAFHNINLDRLVELKSQYNKTRPHRHGGKTL